MLFQNFYVNKLKMLHWLLIVSISLVSFSILMFFAAYFAIFDEAMAFYGV